jgi:hypothetical protein
MWLQRPPANGEVCKRFAATVALDEVSLSVNPGDLARTGERGREKHVDEDFVGGIHAGCGEIDEAPIGRGRRWGKTAGVAMIYQELSWRSVGDGKQCGDGADDWRSIGARFERGGR